MKYTYVLIAAAASLLVFSGCGSGPSVSASGKIPPWVEKTPSDGEYIYSVGISGKTFYPTDAITYATENARREIASMIRTRIVSMTETHDSTRRDDISIESIAVTDEDLQGTEVTRRWIDRNGISGVAAGTTYVLLRMERSQFEQLVQKYR